MAIGDIYRVAIEGSTRGALNVNVVHYEVVESNANTGDEMTLLAQLIDTEVLPAYAPMVSAATSFDVVKVRGVTNPTLGHDRPVTDDGSASGENLPNQIAPEMILRTNLIGGSYRGRIYLWPPTEAFVSNGDLTSAYLALGATLYDAMQPLSITVGADLFQFGLVIYSQRLSVATPVTSHQIPIVPRTQRRRMIGRGA